MGTLLPSDNILLIGFMGSGKSSVGRKLAQALDYQFLDTDTLIESSQGRSISEIFSVEGEAYFRELERKVIDWIGKHASHAVVATGGGLPLHVEQISKAGRIVYLEIDFNSIKSRMNQEEQSKRPLFNDIAGAEELFKSRKVYYERLADIKIKASEPIATIVDMIVANDLIQKGK